jgi:uncharacterized protein YggL (DUF469 family)
MAQRSRRLRKKLRIEEFQELGFELSWNFPTGTAEPRIDAVIDGLIADVIEPRNLAFAGNGHLGWEGLVCTQSIGKCSAEDIKAVCEWLKQQGMENIKHSNLFDIWYGDIVNG